MFQRSVGRLAGRLGLLGILATLAVAGQLLLFSTFMVYDDEGFVLISLRNFITNGALYDDVYTQYGPFFFLWHKALAFLGGWEWTNTSGRWLTLAYWMGIALLSADAVRRLTRNSAAVAVTLAATFCYLWVMIHEPSHPGGLIGFGVALLAWIGVRFDPAKHPGAAGAMAAVATAMALSKINTGLFALLALWGWLAAHSRSSPLGRSVATISVGLCLIAPVVVMSGLLAEPWVRDFAVVVDLALLAMVAVLRKNAPPIPTIAQSWRSAAFAGAATSGLIVVLMLIAGTSIGGLLHGVLLDPLRQPGVYAFAFVWRPGSLVLAVLASIVVFASCRSPETRFIRCTVIGLRVAGAVAMAASALQLLPVSMPAFGLTYGVSLAAVCAIPLRNETTHPARSWLALLLIWQSLHAYPVCGSQLNWGTFLWVPLLTVSAFETLRALPISQATTWIRRSAVVGAWGVAITATATLYSIAQRNHRQGDALGLPGAETIVVPSHTAFPIRLMAQNAMQNADMLFTFTGAYSFNLWTGLPTPTLSNATHWFSLLNENRQHAIIARLESSPRAAIIAQLNTVRYLLDEGISVDSPLTTYIATHFENRLQIDDYALWLKKDRNFTPIGVARWTNAQTAEFTLTTSISSPLTVEFWRYDGDLRIQIGELPRHTFILQAIDSDRADGLSTYALTLNDMVPQPWQDCLLIIRTPDENEPIVVRVLP